MSRKKSYHKPPQAYSDFLSKDVMAKITQNVDARIIQVSQYMAQQQSSLMQNVFLRIAALEELISEKFNVSKDEIADMVAKKQDEAEGYTEKQVAEVGDRVRFTLESKEKGAVEFQDPAKFTVDDLGKLEFTKEVEEALVGMVPGGVTTVELKSGDMLRIKLDRVSTKPKQEEATENANA